jgi:excisionase family DNA binding protein
MANAAKQGATRIAVATRSDLLTADEAARRLRLHVKSLYRLAKAGKIPCRKVGGQWRFHADALDQWLKSAESDEIHH